MVVPAKRRLWDINSDDAGSVRQQVSMSPQLLLISSIFGFDYFSASCLGVSKTVVHIHSGIGVSYVMNVILNHDMSTMKVDAPHVCH